MKTYYNSSLEYSDFFTALHRGVHKQNKIVLLKIQPTG